MVCHELGATLMSEKSKPILFNYLKPSIRGDLPGVWMGKIPWMVGRKSVVVLLDNECGTANLPLTPEHFCLGPK